MKNNRNGVIVGSNPARTNPSKAMREAGLNGQPQGAAHAMDDYDYEEEEDNLALQEEEDYSRYSNMVAPGTFVMG